MKKRNAQFEVFMDDMQSVVYADDQRSAQAVKDHLPAYGRTRDEMLATGESLGPTACAKQKTFRGPRQEPFR